MFRTMAFALMVSVLGLGSPVRADEAEDKAVAFMKKIGGKVIRDEKAPGKPVVTVDLLGTQLTDAGLKELVAFKNLTTLHLAGTKVGDAGVKELVALRTSPHST